MNVKMIGAAALMGICGSASGQLGVNQLLNEGFNNGGFGAAFTDWTTFGGNISQDTTEFVIEGFGSAKIFGNFATDDMGNPVPSTNGFFQDALSFPVSPGQRWRAEIDAAQLAGDEMEGSNQLRLTIVYIDTLGVSGDGVNTVVQGNYVERTTVIVDANTPPSSDPMNVPRYAVDLVAPLGVDRAQIVVALDQGIDDTDMDGNFGEGAAYLDNAFLGLVEENVDIPFYNGNFEDPSPFNQAINGFAEFISPDFFNAFRACSDDPNIVPFDGDCVGFMFGQFNGGENGSAVAQRLPAAEGEMWKAEVQYRHRTGDEIGGDNAGFMNLEFWDASGAMLQMDTIETGTAATPTDQWFPAELSAMAPAGTSEVRIVLGYFQDLFNAGGAIWYDAADLAIDDGTAGCNQADIAEPFGILDQSDIDLFIAEFLGGSGANGPADIAEPFGVLDQSDVDLLIASFLAGCDAP